LIIDGKDPRGGGRGRAKVFEEGESVAAVKRGTFHVLMKRGGGRHRQRRGRKCRGRFLRKGKPQQERPLREKSLRM